MIIVKATENNQTNTTCHIENADDYKFFQKDVMREKGKLIQFSKELEELKGSGGDTAAAANKVREKQASVNATLSALSEFKRKRMRKHSFIVAGVAAVGGIAALANHLIRR